MISSPFVEFPASCSVQIRDAKGPAFADVASWDYSAASFLLQRLRMNAEKCSRFNGIEQRLKLGDRETRLSIKFAYGGTGMGTSS